MEMGSSSSTESLNGLKFGRKIYFEDSSSSSSAQPKKVRSGPAQPGQPPRCQVEGCKADLSDAKAYYSRHKVCGMHSKSPKVIVAGIEQRFCQQCSRFHQLQEFDQGKRSCRRRLAGHNERRRKPPPGSLLSARFGPGGGGGRGSFLMDFSSYPRLGRDVWPPRRVPATAYPPWQGVFENPPPPSDLFMHASVAAGHGGMIPDSSCALSLLSAQPWGPTSRPPAPGFGPRHSMMSSDELAGAGHFPAGSWSVVKAEGTGGDGGPHQAVVPDLGLGHVSQPLGGQFSGELELSHQQSRRPYLEAGHSRDFGSAGQHMNWSL